MNDNLQLILLSVDKTNDLIFLEKTEYKQKLTELFENPTRFQKITNFDLQAQLTAYRTTLFNSIEHCLGLKNKYLVQPKNSISSLYGVVKCNKIE